MEVDLLADPYAAGFGSALSGFCECPITVVNRMETGHLYSTAAAGGEDTLAAPRLKVSERTWQNDVRPFVLRHLVRLRELYDVSSGDAFREAATLFSELVRPHHQLMLPRGPRLMHSASFACGTGLSQGPANRAVYVPWRR